MKIQSRCLVCLLDQALRMLEENKISKRKEKEVLSGVLKLLNSISWSLTPVEAASLVYKKVAKSINKQDPLLKVKEKNNKQALKLYPFLKRELNKSSDKLLCALKISGIGNEIDFAKGNYEKIDLKTLKQSLRKKHNSRFFKYNLFKKHLKNAQEILYLADNSGEVLFDKVLIEELVKIKKEIVYVVKEGPAGNDALLKDAIFFKINKIAKVITNGTSFPGTPLKFCSNEFKKYLKKSNFILSKGQGNFETLEQEKAPIFFLFKNKCSLVSEKIKVPVGEIVLIPSLQSNFSK